MESSLSFTIPRMEGPIPDALTSMPRAFREQARKGFKVLAEVGPQHYAEILQAVIVTLESRRAPLEDLEKHLALSKYDVSSLFAASMLVVPLLSEGVNADEFAAAATKADLIPLELLPKIKPFIDTVVSERPQIGRAMRRATLPAEVLPFVTDVEIAVDVRLAFEGETVREVAPVAMVHIDTDATGEEIWFQASKRQMERLKGDIDRAIKRMEAAETWSRRESKS
jgi:hypothetical protein